MGYRVFLSHNVNREDYPLVTYIANHLIQYGVEPFVPDWFPRYGDTVHKYAASQIESADIVLAIVTSATARSTYVARELASAQAVKKPVVALVENGINTEDLLPGVPRVTFDRWGVQSPYQAAEAMVAHIRGLKTNKEKDDTQKTVLGVALLGLLFWLAGQGGKNRGG